MDGWLVGTVLINENSNGNGEGNFVAVSHSDHLAERMIATKDAQIEKAIHLAVMSSSQK